MVHATQVRLAAAIGDMRLEYRDGVPTLFAMTTQGLTVMALSEGDRPVLITEEPRVGLVGMIRRGGRLYAVGQDGVVVADRTKSTPGSLAVAQRALRGDARRAAATLAAADGPGFVALLTESGLEVLDSNLDKIGQLALPGGQSLAVVGSRAVVATKEGLVSIDLSKPAHPQQLGLAPLKDVRRLGRAPVGGRRHAVWVQQVAGSLYEVFDLTEAERPEGVATFHVVPWFVDRVRLDSLYAGLSPDRRTITIWRAVETRAGLEPPVGLEEIRRG
jgi:hypothetical protein